MIAMYEKRAVKVERIRNECQIRLGGPARWKPDRLCCCAQFAGSVPWKLRTWNEPLVKVPPTLPSAWTS